MNRQVLVIGWLWVLGLPGLGLAAAAEDILKPSPPHRPELWAIVVGIDNYSDPLLRAGSLPERVREATRVRGWFRSHGEWESSHVLYLADFGNPDPGSPGNPEANILPTGKNLNWAFRTWLKSRARPDDLVVFYFAGRAGAVVTPQGPTLEPKVEYFLLPIDAKQGNVVATSWSLDRALDQFVFETEGRCQVVCWLATTVRRGPTAPRSRPAPIVPPGRSLQVATGSAGWCAGRA